MTTEADSDQGVWVEEYVTSTGTHVAGHWRKRATGRSAGTDLARRSATAVAEEPVSPGPAVASRVDRRVVDPASRHDAVAETRRIDIGADPPAAGSVAGTRAASPEREAKVAAGLEALRKRRESLEQHHGDHDEGSRRDRCSTCGEFKSDRHTCRAAEGTVVHPGAAAGKASASETEPFDHRAFVDDNKWYHDRWREDVAAGQPMDPQLRTAIIERLGPQSDRCPDCGQFRGTDHTCPIPDGLPAGDYAGLKGEDRVKAMVADLEDSVKAVVESGQLHRWLDAMAGDGLQRWSANNRLLAVVQMLRRGKSLEGLHMMGLRKWQERFNRKVSKGARAVWILAPVTRRVVEEDDEGNKTEKHRVVAFKGVPVFDVSDTQGDPLPAAPGRPAPGQATPGTLEGLRERVGQAGYTYEETEIPGCRPDTGEGTLGYTEPQTKRIVVDSRLGSAQKASTIAHELGHVHCGHVDGDYGEYRKHRGRMETEAEMTAYLVNRSRGMSRAQVDSFSPGYIAAWSKGEAKVMHAAVEKATGASSKILDGRWSTS